VIIITYAIISFRQLAIITYNYESLKRIKRFRYEPRFAVWVYFYKIVVFGSVAYIWKLFLVKMAKTSNKKSSSYFNTGTRPHNLVVYPLLSPNSDAIKQRIFDNKLSMLIIVVFISLTKFEIKTVTAVEQLRI